MLGKMDFVCTYAADPKARGTRAGAGSPARRALRLRVAGAVPGAAVAGAVGEPEIEFQLDNVKCELFTVNFQQFKVYRVALNLMI